MHQFLHGITRAFLTACGGSLSTCLPLPPFDGGEQEGQAEATGLQPNLYGKQDQANEADNVDLQPELEGQDKGDLLPLSGEDYRHNGSSLADADNADLQPQKGQNNGDLQPTRGDVDEAVNFDLQPAYIVGHKEEKGDAENSDLQQTALCDGQDKGDLLPTNGDEDVADNLDLQPINLGHQNNNLLLQLTKEGDGKFWPSIGVNSSNGEFFSSLQDYPQFDVMHDWKHYLFAYMHTQIGGFGMAFGVHDDVLITYAKPQVDPKVKKKTSLLLYLTIYSPFHPGEYGHDGSPQHPHHDPYSMILAIDFTPQAILIVTQITIMITSSPRLPNTAAENEDTTSLLLLLQFLKDGVHGELAHIDTFLIPLRGRKCDQWNDEALDEDVAVFKIKPIRRRTTMQLPYINKDLLDPG